MSAEAPVGDVDRLLTAFAAGSLMRPSADVPNIVDLGRSLALLAGNPDVRPTPNSDMLAGLIGPSDHLVFVLVDGLGKRVLESLPDDSFLTTHLVADIRTVFPSTTAVALTSLATGEWPGKHGVTGWWTHLPEIGSTAAILRFIRRSDGRSLLDLDVTPETAFPIPTLMARTPREALAVFPENLAESVFSTYVSGGKERRGYGSLPEAIDFIAKRLRQARGPTYTYLYTHRIDSTAHLQGATHDLVREAVCELDREVERLARKLDGNGRIVLTADHGFLDVPARGRYQIRGSDSLMGLLRSPPSGDARVMYLHVRPGFEGRVRYRLGQRFGDRFMVIRTEEAEALELFGPGPMTPVARSRIGDLIVISSGGCVIDYHPAGGGGRVMSQRSHHSGLTPDEMVVPLVVA